MTYVSAAISLMVASPGSKSSTTEPPAGAWASFELGSRRWSVHSPSLSCAIAQLCCVSGASPAPLPPPPLSPPPPPPPPPSPPLLCRLLAPRPALAESTRSSGVG
jgi:hypothetical protein